METRLPTPTTTRVELLIYQRVGGGEKSRGVQDTVLLLAGDVASSLEVPHWDWPHFFRAPTNGVPSGYD